MDDAVTFVAECVALCLAVSSSRCVVAILAEGKCGDGGGEVDALMGGGGRGRVLVSVAGVTDNRAMTDAEDGGGRRQAAVANCPDTYQAGH